ncbi:T9SS type A sorting domain-containing protein [candidate division KSB1 bacterium]|nr:T9SS type A sorting domain-containing protein [candidate division KSB1 bacterium]
MKITRFTKTALLFFLMLCYAGILYPQQPAFPTAEGFGKYTVGGRGGKVYEVTNLNDSGPGSLRAAVNSPGTRTVVFRVSGTIDLKSNLDINYPYITIAGQTAPGDGICIKNYPLKINTDQVIIRYLRVRLGDESGVEADAVSSRYTKNIIVDHVSASWSVDETISIYHCDSVTVQWCVISESMFHSSHIKGNHGYGGIWGGPNGSFHHNLIAHHSSRNPRFSSGCGNTDFRNNVIYNWGGQSIYGGEKLEQGSSTYTFSAVNMVANFYKQGPGTRGGSVQYRIVQPSSRNYLADYGEWYITGNYIFGYPNVTADNWILGVQPDQNTQTVKDSIRSEYPAPFIPIEQHSAEEAYQLVLENAGAILPRRDSVDQRIVQEVTGGTATYGTGTYNRENGYGSRPTGIIDSQKDVGGWPALYTGPASEDSDHDGMPDSWEFANGLNPENKEDRNGIGEGGYTNLEIYLNSITEFPPFLRAPSNVTAELTGFTKVLITWEDFIEDETGFRIERAEGEAGNFITAAEVEANVTTCADSGLEELTLYRYRVVAFNSSLVSGYEGIAEVTTLSPTSPPLAVSFPSPEDNTRYVVTAPLLTWEPSMNADSYDVYFGQSNPPPFILNQRETVFVPGELEKGTRYYWRIDGVNQNGTTQGSLWRFMVEPDIPSGQIVYWKFDETEGTTVADEEMYGIDGTLKNMEPTSWTDGVLDGGLGFDGQAGYVLVPHNGILDFSTESFSLSAWSKAEPLTGSSMYLINKGSFAKDETAGTTGRWYGIEIKNNELRFAIDDDVAKSQATVAGADALLSEKWAHIVGVRDTAEGTLKLYINGELLSSVSDATGSISQEEDMFLGNSTTGTAPLWGVLDDVRIYNYALVDAEVQAIYASVPVNKRFEEKPPNEFLLAGNYPNPFNPLTRIEYVLPEKSMVKLQVFDILGRKVATLVDGIKEPGNYAVNFDGSNLGSGLYVYKLTAGYKTLAGKMLLVK